MGTHMESVPLSSLREGAMAYRAPGTLLTCGVTLLGRRGSGAWNDFLSQQFLPGRGTKEMETLFSNGPYEDPG